MYWQELRLWRPMTFPSAQPNGRLRLGMAPTYAYGSQASAVPSTAARRGIVLCAPPTSTTIWPGDFVEINLPEEALPDCEYALEPRSDAPTVRKLTASHLWPPPRIVSSVAGKIRIPNLSSEPHYLKRNEHFCQVNPVFSPAINVATCSTPSCEPCPRPSGPTGDLQHNSSVRLDPENALPPDIRAKFQPNQGIQWCRRVIRSSSKHGSSRTSSKERAATPICQKQASGAARKMRST